MSKILPAALLSGMACMLLISWNNVLQYDKQKNAEFNARIEEAQRLEEKEIYIDAVAEYESALSMRPDDFEIAMKIVDLYEKLDKNGLVNDALETAIKTDPTQREPYIRLIDRYMAAKQYKKAIAVYNQAEENIGIDEEIEEKMVQIRSDYALTGTYCEMLTQMHYVEDGKNGFYIGRRDNLIGLMNDSNKVGMEFKNYEEIGLLNDKLMPVKKNGEYYYVDESGYRKLVPDRPAEYFGTFNNGYAPAKFDGVYGYVDKKLKEYNMEYSYAGCFENNVAAVQKDGKWALINNSLANVTDFIFDEILCDEYGFCSTYGVFIAKLNGQYYVYDLSGNQLSEGFDDARMFASEQPAAMKRGNKWCFVSKTGETVIETDYEDANSFSLGYAPVKEKGKWGCIDQRDKMLIPTVFDELKPFAKNGYAYACADDLAQFIVVQVY